MDDDLTLLLDIAQAAEKIERFVAGMGAAAFLGDEKTQSAVVREIIVVGEAANHVSAAFRAAHPDIPCVRLVNLRHFYVHACRRLDYREVWRAASRQMPRILQAVHPHLPQEPDDDAE